MSVAIELQGLSKRFKEKVAVSPMTLSINQGELFGLLGVNGAGKTTVINMLSALSNRLQEMRLYLGIRLVKSCQVFGDYSLSHLRKRPLHQIYLCAKIYY